MNIKLRALIHAATLSLLCLCLSPINVHAQQADSAQQSSTREQAAKKALRMHGSGKVLGVRKKSRGDGSVYYEVKILTDGQVSIYEIDA